MDLQASKIELAKLILSIENPKLVSRILNLLKSEEEDFWTDLTKEQKQLVHQAKQEFERGEKVSWEDLKNRVA